MVLSQSSASLIFVSSLLKVGMVRALALGASVPGTRWALVPRSLLMESCLEGVFVFVVLFSGRNPQGLGQSGRWAWGSQGNGQAKYAFCL